MNILFISSLPHSLSTGPAWSVPARIAAQEKIDNVMWINLSPYEHLHYKNVKSYHNISEFNSVSLLSLPKPFNRPDLVVFEGFYSGFTEMKFAKECWKYNIPYIITPRCSLTYQAMHNKSRWKKEIAHLLFYDKFVKRSLAIQFLTKQEYEDSKYRFNVQHIILPNGFNKPERRKKVFSDNSIKGIFIGRIDIYQKGLDLLLDVIESIKDKLTTVNFSLIIYGPKSKDYNVLENTINSKKIDSIVKLGGEILSKEKQEAILNSDIFFLTSRFEGHPMGLIEALSYGLPCIITTGANMREEVKNYDAGWCSDFSFEGIKKSILDMVNQKTSYQQKSQNAIKLAANYEWDTLAKDFSYQINKLI